MGVSLGHGSFQGVILRELDQNSHIHGSFNPRRIKQLTCLQSPVRTQKFTPDFSYKCELALNLCSEVGLMAVGFVEQEGQKGTPECFVCFGQRQHGQQYGAQSLQLGQEPLGS